ncbi:MAG: PilZ domain-containing protein [Calditrichaeota bacterium]|nr:PilZ domain-containing protein [Calditrichota bacterium]
MDTQIQTFTKPQKERRRYYRLRPSMPEKILAEIFFLGNKHCTVQVVNLSPGGVLVYTTHCAEKFHKGDILPRIDLQFPHKSPITYAGEIVRLEPTGDPDAIYCAIKFEKFGGLTGTKIPSKKAAKINTVQEEAIFLTRLRQAENYTNQDSIQDEIRMRTHVYESFRDITEHLRMEERWFFLEVLDELKRQEPAYSQGLLKEYLRFCTGEDRTTQVASDNKIKTFLKNFL